MPALRGFIRQVVVIFFLTLIIIHLPRQSKADQLLGEIRWVAFGFAPQGWAKCDGALLPISQNQALFALLGTTYGGDGRTTFALPDMRGRSPLGADYASYPQGQVAGHEQVALTIANLPLHTHAVQARSSAGDSASPTNRIWANSPSGNQLYKSSGSTTPLASGIVGSTGSGQAFSVMQPYAVLNCIIATTGIFPSRP